MASAASSDVARSVYLSTALAMVSYALLIVVLPFRFEALGLSIVEYGLALAISALGMLLTESVWGALAFRIGRPRTLLALGGAVALVLVLLGFSRTFPEVGLALGAYGALVVFPIPLTRWLALTAMGPGTGGRGTGRWVVSFGIGLAVGSAIGPTIYAMWGFLPTIAAALLAFLVSVVVIARVPWERVDLPARPPSRGGIRPILTRHFALCVTLVALAYVAYTLPTNFLQYYSVSVFRGTGAEAGYVIGAYRGAQMIAGFLLGAVVDRRGPARSVPFGFLLVAAGAIATLFASSYGEMAAATLLFALGTGWLSAALLPLALEPVPRALQGTAIGAVGSFEDLGLLVGPLVLSSAYAGLGAGSLFVLVAGIALAGAAIAAAARGAGVIGASLA